MAICVSLAGGSTDWSRFLLLSSGRSFDAMVDTGLADATVLGVIVDLRLVRAGVGTLDEDMLAE